MKRFVYLSCFIFLLISACNQSTETKEQEYVSPEEKHMRDSISKIEQSRRADSLKKINPLLIIPPDSTYTGAYTDKYPGGIVKFKGFFRFGKRHGQWMSFYPSGLLWSEMHYDKGLRHGPNITYFEDGIIRYTGFYKNDMKDSTWCFYDSLGVLAKKVVYHHNRIVKELPLK